MKSVRMGMRLNNTVEIQYKKEAPIMQKTIQ